MKLGFLMRQLLGDRPLVGDIRHYRHHAACADPAARDPVDSAVGRAVFEIGRCRIAQALDAPRHQLVAIALTVIAVRGKEAQKSGIGTPGLKQLVRHGIHFFEAVVAEDDV